MTDRDPASATSALTRDGRPDVPQRLASWFAKYQVQALGLLLGAIAWEVVGRIGVSPALPPISAVIAAGAEMLTSEREAERFLVSVRTTAASILIALPPSLIFGVTLGLLMGLFRPIEWILRPWVNASLSLPLVAIIPIIMLMFGLSQTTIVAVIILYVTPVVMVNTLAGVRSTDRDLVEMAESFSADKRLILKRIVVPSARGLTLAGIRIGVGRSISGGIVAEQVVGVFGVGGLVQRLGGAFAVEDLYAVIIFIGLVGVASLALINRIEQSYAIKGG